MTDKTEQELTMVHFIAQMINQQKSLAQGYTMPVRWLTLRKDLQDVYLSEANEIFNNWKNEELKALEARNSMKFEIKEYPE